MYNSKKGIIYLGIFVFTQNPSNVFANISNSKPEESLRSNFELSGWVRANIQDNNFSDNDRKLSFNAAKLSLRYDSEKYLGDFEYRCYQNHKLCDFSSLVNANIGYKFNPKHKLTLGVQELPFGPDRGWSTSWYGGILASAGLEDIHNLGINYEFYPQESTKINLAYFSRDAGNYIGNGLDASRYTTNFVKPENPEDSRLKEKNMFLGRLEQNLPTMFEDLSVSLGGSYWYSTLKNKTYNDTGHRNSWNIFSRTSYKNFNLTLTGGKNKINNKDPLHSEYSVIGSFDNTYLLANNAKFYTADLRYIYKAPNHKFTFTPYATYTLYDKDLNYFKDSTRHILGSQIDIKNVSVAAEYIIGKNDVSLNGTSQSLAMGDEHGSNRMLNILFFYNF